MRYLKAIEIENFKCFEKRVRIPLAPITLIYGENSAGKSSIIQALSLLKQTLDFAPSGVPLLPRTDLGYVDLGSFTNMLHDHDGSKSLWIRLEMREEDVSYTSCVSDLIIEDPYETKPRSYAYGMKFQLVPKTREIALEELHLSFHHEDGLADEPRDYEWVAVHRETAPPGMMTIPQTMRDVHYGQETDAYDVFHDNRHHVLAGINVYIDLKVVSQYDRKKPEYKKLLKEELALNFLRFPSSKGMSDADRSAAFKKGQQAQKKRIQRAWSTMKASRTYKNLRHRIEKRYRTALDFYSRDFDKESFRQRCKEEPYVQSFHLRNFLLDRRVDAPHSRDEEFLQCGVRNAYVSYYMGGDVEDWCISWPTGSTEKNFSGKPHDLTRFASWIASETSSLLAGYHPLAPIRKNPERWYVFSGTAAQSVGLRGELFADTLLKDKGTVNRLNGWLRDMGVDYRVALVKLGSKAQDMFILKLLDTRRRKPVEVSIADVGYGICQVLPFLVQALCSHGKLIAIEQPEVHIHPRLQAELGEFLASCIRKPCNNRFLIETHSEHLMLRIQKLMRNKKLTPDDVCVLYVSRGQDGSTVQQLRLNKQGEFLDRWPNGFFSERIKELFD